MDIIGNDMVTLRTGTVHYPMAFIFSPASSPTANDGSIPYGTTIISAVVTVSSFGGADITTATVGQAVVDGTGLQVNVTFNYPQPAKKGKCVTLLKLTLSSGAVIVKRWDGLNLS